MLDQHSHNTQENSLKPTFSVKETIAHDKENLPEDVMVLYKLNDIDRFMESSCDLAICNISFPKGFDQLIDECLEKKWLETVKTKDLQTLMASISPEAQTILAPYLPIVESLWKHLKVSTRLTLKAVNDQMCPLFHVDNLKMRMIVTLKGPGTQWLKSEDVIRQNLGKGGKKPISRANANLQEVQVGQVAILKGAAYPGSKGLVHRSPGVSEDEQRLFLRFDFDF